MSRLFIKIFLGFWLVTLVVLASWGLSMRYLEELPVFAATEERPKEPPHRFFLRLIYSLQNEPLEELPDLIARSEERFGVRIFVVDAAGNEIQQRKLPPPARRVLRKLQGAPRRVADHTPNGPVMGHDFFRQDEGRMRVIVMPPRGSGRLAGLLQENWWLRVSLAVLASGLVCYLLSLLLTRRIKRLGQTARSLADGDLDARIDVRPAGGDETDQLARDFNRMAEQLQERIQAQRRLLSDVSHELRSPLARMQVALALLRRGNTGDNAHIERIEREADRLEELISQLLSVPDGEIPLTDHIDLVFLLDELCTDAGFEGKARGVRVQFHSELSELTIATHGDLLKKCFENILRNALHHSPEGARVQVALTTTGSDCTVTVQDAGPGIPESELERVFDTFYRVDTARARETGGYGLGLAIARRACEAHAGSISAANIEPGLEVTVCLPTID